MRFRPPPPPAGGYGKHKTEKFSLHFLIFSRTIFSFKRKKNSVCVSLSLKNCGNALFLIAKGQKFLPRTKLRFGIRGVPPDPLPFCSFAFRASPDLSHFFASFIFCANEVGARLYKLHSSAKSSACFKIFSVASFCLSGG